MEVPKSRGRTLAYLVGVLAVALVLITMALSSLPPAKTESLTSSNGGALMSSTSTTAATRSTESSTSRTITILNYSTTSNSTAVPAACPSRVDNLWFGTLDASTGSVSICIEVYEFNTNSTVQVNTIKLLSIFGYPPGTGGVLFGSGGNFTTSSNSGTIEVGGPQNVGEGDTIVFTITENSGATGTFLVNFNGWLLGPNGPDDCGGGLGEIVAGTGQPNYTVTGGCITTATTAPGTYYSVTGIPYLLDTNTLYYRVIGVGNSTR